MRRQVGVGATVRDMKEAVDNVLFLTVGVVT